MKKVLYLVFASMFFFACSNDEQVPVTQDLGNQVVFNITTGDLTRGTALYSQEAPLNIADVKIYVFESGVYDQTFTVSNWSSTDNEGSYAITAPSLLSGSYEFFAVGRETGDGYTLPTLTVGTTTSAQMAASLSTAETAYDLFSGTASATLTGAPAMVDITMTRKVSGFLGYFTNIPVTLDSKTVATLRVTASTANQTVNLATGTGSAPAADFDLMDIDLTGQTAANGYYTGNAVGGGVAQLPNSQLGGGYLLPTTGVTLTVGLYDAGGVAIKTWTVSDGDNSIDIAAGTFYSIGTKEIAANTTGDDPDDNTDDGDPADDDKGMSLGGDTQVINVSLDPAWGIVTALTLVENP